MASAFGVISIGMMGFSERNYVLNKKLLSTSLVGDTNRAPASRSLLLVDPAEFVNHDMLKQLSLMGYDIHPCRDALSAFELAARQHFPLVLVDSRLPDMGCLAFIRQFQQHHMDSLLLAMVDETQGREAAEAIHAGAIDYLHKPFTAQQLDAGLQHALRLFQPVHGLIAVSHASRQVLQLARRAARTTASILIGGESGTGKEKLARFIHDNSPRATQPFVAINCAAIPENMLEATLFGYNKGAFTGATCSQPGKFEMAQSGTLLLDEISELSLSLQAKLLRVLQEREVERLGSHQRIALDVRIIVASNQNLRQLVEQGLFREDLFYRVDVLPLAWPSLRDRRDDILPLARYFIEIYAPQPGYCLSSAACQTLLAYDWPGNVRELENVIQRALIMTRGLRLQPEDLMLPTAGPVLNIQDVASPPEGVVQISLAASKRQAEFQYVLDILRRFNGHRTRTAEALGMTTRALRYKLAAMREYGIDIDRQLNV